jgi:hypothetical protein
MSHEGNPVAMYPEGFGVLPAVQESEFEEPHYIYIYIYIYVYL